MASNSGGYGGRDDPPGKVIEATYQRDKDMRPAHDGGWPIK